jgi:hypothetical protein
LEDLNLRLGRMWVIGSCPSEAKLVRFSAVMTNRDNRELLVNPSGKVKPTLHKYGLGFPYVSEAQLTKRNHLLRELSLHRSIGPAGTECCHALWHWLWCCGPLWEYA